MALVVEGRVQRGRLVEVRGQLVRGVLGGGVRGDLAELVQVQPERPLGRGQRQLRVGHRAGLARPAQDRLDTGVGVLEVDRGVAVERDHLVQVELVVAGGGGRQVGVLDRADAHLGAALGDLLLGELLLDVLLADHGGGALHGLVEQVDQPDRLALAGLEGLAVLAEDGAEGELDRLHLLAEPAGPPGRLEDHLEVERLPCVHHVEQGVGLELEDAVADGGEVGGRVAEAAVGLLHDQRDRLAVGALHVVEEDAEGALGADRDTGLLQQAAGLREHGVVPGLAHHVGVVDLHVELVEDGVEVDLRLVHEPLPHGQRLRVARLEVDHPAPGAGLELLVGVEEGAARLVEPVEARHGLLTGLHAGLAGLHGGTLGGGGQLARVLDQVLDEHAELGAPVADVVAADHLLTGELQHPHDRVADHGRAQVADVHLLGDVRLGVVDHRGAGRLGERHAEAGRVGGAGREVPGDGGVGEGEVEEAGPGDLDVLDHLVRPDGVDDLGGQLARVALELLGEGQDAVGLVVGPVATSQQRVGGAGLRQGSREGVRETLVDGSGERGDRGHGVGCRSPWGARGFLGTP